MSQLIDPFIRGKVLRRKLVKENGVMCVDFHGTLQQKDIEVRNNPLVDPETGSCSYRSKINVKMMDDGERAKKGLGPFDFSEKTKVIEALNNDFDFGDWLRTDADKNDISTVQKYNLPLAYQLKGCNLHDGSKTGGCRYCFVDDNSNSPTKKNSAILSAENIVNTFIEARKDNAGLNHIRISGGEPSPVLDHILNVLEEAYDKQGIDDATVQFDCNLSTGRLIDYFIEENVFEKNILEKIAEYDPRILVAFKGTSDENIQYNTQAKLTLDEQIDTAKMFTNAGLRWFPSIYNPVPEELSQFADKLEENFQDGILNMVHLYSLLAYGPTEARLSAIAMKEGLNPEKYIISCKEQWKENYERGTEIWSDIVRKRTGLEYKGKLRSEIEIKLK